MAADFRIYSLFLRIKCHIQFQVIFYNALYFITVIYCINLVYLSRVSIFFKQSRINNGRSLYNHMNNRVVGVGDKKNNLCLHSPIKRQWKTEIQSFLFLVPSWEALTV